MWKHIAKQQFVTPSITWSATWEVSDAIHKTWFSLPDGECLELFCFSELKTVLLLLLSRFSHVWFCPTDPIDGSLPGSATPGILQARTLEWVAISFSSAWKWKVKMKSSSCVLLFTTPWTAAYQAPPSMGFSRQEYWNGVPLPSPELKM